MLELFKRIRIGWMIAISFFLLIGWMMWMSYEINQLNNPETIIKIPPGVSNSKIAEILSHQGVIDSPLYFKWASRNKALQSGTYKIPANAKVNQIVYILSKGITYKETVTFTIPEGFNTFQIAKTLEEKGLVKASAFLEASKNGRFLLAGIEKLPVRQTRLEGYLFPDTYIVDKNSSAEEIIQMMLNRFEAIRKQIGLDKNVRKQLIIASLIEKEALLDKERPRIAGVILNRLTKKMMLQIDATVLYAQGKHKERVTYADLKVNSPYNTYLHIGLPPGPIASPGKASLEAAMHPEKNSYYFYVATKNGSHLFSRTYAEHQKNVKKAQGT